MFLGVKMTPAAAQRLKFEGVPQERAVCVPRDLWEEYVLGETPIERTCYVIQILHDLNDCLSQGRGDSRLADVAAVTMKWGLVKEFRDDRSRKISSLELVVSFINKMIARQAAPRIAVSEDGRLVRASVGELRDLTGVRFQHFGTAGQVLLDRYKSEAEYARINSIYNPIAYGSTEYFKHLWEAENGRELIWQQ